MKTNGDRHPEEIQEEIRRTRQEMDRTLRAIEHRLSPGQLVDRAIDYARHSGGTEFVSNLGNQAKNNPMPVAMMGIAMAWLMAAGRSSGADHSRAYTPGEGSERGMSEKLGQAKGRLSETAASTKEKMSGMSQAAKEKWASMSEGTRGMASRTTESARHYASQAGEVARQARGGFNRMLHEQPLALGAIGLALGAIAAASLPRTRKEDEMMGEAKDRLAERAKEAGKEQLEKAKQVAGAAGEAAKKEAERQGVTPGGGSASSGGVSMDGGSASSGAPSGSASPRPGLGQRGAR